MFCTIVIHFFPVRMFSFIVRAWHPTITHSSKYLKANVFELKKFTTNCCNNILQHFMTVIKCSRYVNQKCSHETFFNDPYVFGSCIVCSPNEQANMKEISVYQQTCALLHKNLLKKWRGKRESFLVCTDTSPFPRNSPFRDQLFQRLHYT